MENNLPEGWEIKKLRELCSKPQYGWTSKAGNSGKVKYLRTTDISNGELNWETVPFCIEIPEDIEKFQVKKNDILVSRAGSVGFNYRIKKDVSFPAVFASYLIRFKATDEVTSRYLEYFLQSEEYWKQISDFTAGIAIPNVNASKLEELNIQVAPESERKNIVERLDNLFEKINSNQARLEKIPQLLKHFRQSVLAAAVSGKGERTITDNVCEFIQIGPFGTLLHKHDYISNGIPLVNPTHIQSGEIIPDFDFTVSKKKFNELSNYHLKEGDVIMGRRGEMARCALIEKKENGWLCGTGSLFFRPYKEKINPKYLFWMLSNNHTKEFLEGESLGTTMSNLNLNIAKRIPILLPSLKEQHDIVRRVEQSFSLADKIEERFNKAKSQMDKLPQAVLSKAFRGELVKTSKERIHDGSVRPAR